MPVPHQPSRPASRQDSAPAAQPPRADDGRTWGHDPVAGGGSGSRAESSGSGPEPEAHATLADPTDARDAAIRAIIHVVLAGSEGDFLAPRTDQIEDPRDVGLALAIYDAAIRRLSTIEFIASRYLMQPIMQMPAPARAALICGAAQLLFLDRVPAHAAINESVEWVRRNGQPRLTGVVNAVLRKIAGLASSGRLVSRYEFTPNHLPRSDGGALVVGLDERGVPLLPTEPARCIATATGTPERLVRHWGEAFGREEAIRQSLHRLASAPTVLNVGYLKKSIPEDGLLAYNGPGTPRHRVWIGPYSAMVELLGSRRDVWVQDASSARAVSSAAEIVGSLSGGVVLDLCAGQGTKTRQLAACFPEATIFATDSDLRRVGVLRSATAHLPRVRVLEIGELASRMANRPNMIMLDVPCSNSGVLARRVEAALRWSESQTARLVALQRQLLRQAREMLAPGGWILYSTCSMDRAENQEQAAWAADQLGLDLLAEEATFPAGLPGGDPAAYRDGAYWAVLRAGAEGGPRRGSAASHSARAGGVHSDQLPTLPGDVLPAHGSKEPTA